MRCWACALGSCVVWKCHLSSLAAVPCVPWVSYGCHGWRVGFLDEPFDETSMKHKDFFVTCCSFWTALFVLDLQHSCWTPAWEFINDRVPIITSLSHKISAAWDQLRLTVIFQQASRGLALVQRAGLDREWQGSAQNLPSNIVKYYWRIQPLHVMASHTCTCFVSWWHSSESSGAMCSSKTHTCMTMPLQQAGASQVNKRTKCVPQNSMTQKLNKGLVLAPEGWDLRIHERVWERQRPSWHWKLYEQVEVEAPSESLKRFWLQYISETGSPGLGWDS